MAIDYRVVIDSPETQHLIQRPMLARYFQRPLVRAGIRRRDIPKEPWETDNESDEKTWTIDGLMQPSTMNATPGRDPVPMTAPIEQYRGVMEHANGTTTHKWVNNRFKMADHILSRSRSLAWQAARSLDMRVRDRQHAVATAGHATLAEEALNSATTLELTTVFGFHQARNEDGSHDRASLHQEVSVNNPLPITVGTALHAAVVIGVTPRFRNDPYGPGTVTLQAPLDTGGPTVPAGAPVYAKTRSRLVRAGNRPTDRAITAGDQLTLAHLSRATQRLGSMWVGRYPDGRYHAYADTVSVGQLVVDSRWDTITDALPEHQVFKDQTVRGVSVYGVIIYSDDQAPSYLSARRTDRGKASPTPNTYVKTDQYVGALVSDDGTPIHSVLVCGADSGVEHFMYGGDMMPPEEDILPRTEDLAMNVAIDQVTMYAEHVKMLWGKAANLEANKTTQTWFWYGTHVFVPDSMSGDDAVFKRQCVIQHAGGDQTI